MRFHVLAVPHTVTDQTYSACAFTQKVLKFCKMMHARGHEVLHYGHERSKVQATEHITVMNDKLLHDTYGDYDWRAEGFKHSTTDAVHVAFNSNAIVEVQKRKKTGDFLLLFWSAGHAPIAMAHKDMIIVEPGIGSHNKIVAPFAIFESYAVMHHAYAKQDMLPRFSDAVVPNYFDVNDFFDASEGPPGINDDNDDSEVMRTIKALAPGYCLFIGRIIPIKGIQLALDVCKATNRKLVIAGQGNIKDCVPGDYDLRIRPASDPTGVTCIGYVEPRERGLLLARAHCLLMPTLYSEPFGGVNVEAQITGIPVVTTDWGAFTETVDHGVTGYRCRTMEHFVWAVNNCGFLDRKVIRNNAIQNYGLTKVATMYEEVFAYILKASTRRGFFASNVGRMGLSWLSRK
jgi:glycosyltransferase involved in cell wall biosynthesis